MYQTDEEYKLKVYEPSTRHLLKIYINDIEIDKKYILDCKLSKKLFPTDEFCLGSVVSKAMEIKLYRTVVPETINKVYIESGITGKIIPIGYFNVDDINKEDDYIVTLKLLDNMIKFEFNYDGSKLTYPSTLQNILQDISNKSGVELRFYFFFKYE